MAQMVTLGKTLDLLEEVFEPVLHVKRVKSLAIAVFGAMFARRLNISEIGRASAEARGTTPKHGIKQVDRLVGNVGLSIDQILTCWVLWVIGARGRITVTMDWTDFDADGHTTLAINLVTRHGRATPLAWMTVEKATLRGNRSDYETELLLRLKAYVPKDVQVVLLADRGFGDVSLYSLLQSMGWAYVIRFKGGTWVTTQDGDSRYAKKWLLPKGRPRLLRDVLVTKKYSPVATVVVVKDPKMKDAWYLASNLKAAAAQDIISLYGRRFSCEENFRDGKDDRFGLGFKEASVSTTARRDILLAIGAVAMALLTLLGAAGEALGCDRDLKANTTKRRAHSLFRQGREYIRGVRRAAAAGLKRLFWSLVRQVSHVREECWAI